MPAQRLSMRKIKEVLRLCWANGLSKRKIAMSCGISRPAVDEYLRRAAAAGLSWPLPADLDEGTLERLLFPGAPTLPAQDRGLPDWFSINRELKRKGVTLFLLWQEYREHHPQGYQYSWFCEHYRAWRGQLDVVMRQDHRAGEKLFVDYAGQTVAVVDSATGELREAQIFVAVLGASNYTYAEATWTQGLPDWIGSHQRCFRYLGGVPQIVVPDNLRSGVTKAHRYEPDANPTYQDMAAHYGVAVLPTRVRRPRDKAWTSHCLLC
jgi:transposase